MATSYTTTSYSAPATNSPRYDAFSPAPAAARPAVSQPAYQSQYIGSQDNFGFTPSFATLGAAAPAAGQQNLGDALLNKPLDVFGGALLSGSQQLGLRPDANQLMSQVLVQDRKSTRLNSSHLVISYAVFCLKKKTY